MKVPGKRATPEEMAARHDRIYEIVRANLPTGIRFTYYTAAARGLVEKRDTGYVKVQRAILEMRRSGRIPWPWIVDTNRWMRKPRTWGSVEELLEETARTYRRALWRNAPVLLEVWCESESVAGVLYPVTSKWDVPLYPIKGQTSDSFAYSAAQNYKGDPRRLTILYVGDHDPAGYEIETNLHAKLMEHSGRRDIAFARLACTAEDVATLGLTGTPPKKHDYIDALTGERVPWSGPAIEVEAIEPPRLRARLDSAIAEHAPKRALEIARVAEESEREILRAFARTRRAS
ncbi:MAG: hypothetical protein FIB00_12000 [Chloroflexi bacterium]|nr:hypothetical protein [Chloroflexota bacterium]